MNKNHLAFFAGEAQTKILVVSWIWLNTDVCTKETIPLLLGFELSGGS